MSAHSLGRVGLTVRTAACSFSKACLQPRRSRVPRRSVRVCAASIGAFGSSFDSLFEDMDREMSAFQRQVERDVDGALKQARNVQEKMERHIAAPESGWRVERSEGRDGWGRSYFVEVTATYQPVQPRSAALQAPSVPLLFGLAVLFGAYFSAVASFLRNFHLTRSMQSKHLTMAGGCFETFSMPPVQFAEDKRLLLAVTGPLLAVVSPRFRRQWLAALRGERAPIKELDSV